MYKTTKWTVATFCLVAAVFGCVAENVIQNTLTNYERIFYATLVKTYEEVRKSAGFTLDGTIDAETM
ncbi:hypothetical protein H7K32_26745 [Brevibacillus agri]|uniref:hypothetical protein n=1 Tax=Brevibacillus agri TaxID=51101 RepID=UPI001C8D6CB8|nr:hypothetical protein [Brevibacillus agri]MBY0055148.1 hypothetical protein [Brevibacillus agri]